MFLMEETRFIIFVLFYFKCWETGWRAQATKLDIIPQMWNQWILNFDP